MVPKPTSTTTQYHGGSFTGNGSRGAFKALDQICCVHQNLQFFNENIGAGYGRNLEHRYKEKIEQFAKRYLDILLSVTRTN